MQHHLIQPPTSQHAFDVSEDSSGDESTEESMNVEGAVPDEDDGLIEFEIHPIPPSGKLSSTRFLLCLYLPYSLALFYIF